MEIIKIMIKESEFFNIVDEQIEAFSQNFDFKKEKNGKYDFEKLTYDVLKEQEKDLKVKSGHYECLNFSNLILFLKSAQNYATKKLFEVLKKFFGELKITKNSLILCVGLGNRGIVSDSLGSMVTQKLLATSSIPLSLRKDLGCLCFLNTSVGGLTGVESFLIAKSVTKNLKPDLIIFVDTLLTHSLKRLGVSFQVSNSGITPGAGVFNPQKSLDKNSLKAPVLAIGVPMLILGKDLGKNILTEAKNMAFATKEVDIYIKVCSQIIADAINKACHGSGYKNYI
ncbi:MAG: GPR endopeptidase [Clostridia bacterium]|nr:GPR endopeptidase [Clostridia bacterium]